MDFGSIVVGTSKRLTGTLSATGSSVTVTSATVSTSEFVLSALSFLFTIAAGQSTPFTLTFIPQASGTVSASVSFAGNASNSSAVESLTGSSTATAATQRQSFVESQHFRVVGYNVYRGGKSGGPYTKINSSLEASVTYTDSSAQARQTYFYVTTSVEGGGAESSYSNEVQAVIPSP